MSHKKWQDQSPARRGLLLTVGLLDAGLRAWALVDLVKRPQEEVKGNKAAWALALALVNSVGIVPATYLGWARHTR